jgi:hypothetical protein
VGSYYERAILAKAFREDEHAARTRTFLRFVAEETLNIGAVALALMSATVRGAVN